MADTENDSAGVDHTQDQTPSRKPFNVGRGIFREIMKFVRDVYGNETLPDDDLGRAVLWELLNQLVLNGAAPDKVRKRGIDLLPEIDDDDSLDDMLKDIGAGRKRKSNDIACNIGLDFQRRDRLQIRFIGCCDKSKAERKAIYAQLKAANQRWKREQDRAMGIKAKLRPKRKKRKAPVGQPWKAKGTSRAAWYRQPNQRRGRPSLGAPWEVMGVSRATYFRSRRETKIDTNAGLTPAAKKWERSQGDRPAAETKERDVPHSTYTDAAHRTSNVSPAAA